MNTNAIKQIIRNPKKLLGRVNHRYPTLLKLMSDTQCVQFWYKHCFGKKLDLENPKTFNEKLQWLKLYNRNPEYTKMVDKYEAKKYVAERIGEEYIIQNLGVWDCFDQIDFNTLPDQFVLKCTHDSGGLVVCKNKATLNINHAKKKLNRSLKRNYYWVGREWPYKDVKPRIIAEKYINLNQDDCAEYKLFCFDGKVKVILVCKGEAHNDGTGARTNDFLDENFNRIPVMSLNPNSKEELVCPKEMETIKMLAEKLSAGVPQLRVDFYLVCGKIYFGELTFFHNSGFSEFVPQEYDEIFGNLIHLPSKKIDSSQKN